MLVNNSGIQHVSPIEVFPVDNWDGLEVTRMWPRTERASSEKRPLRQEPCLDSMGGVSVVAVGSWLTIPMEHPMSQPFDACKSLTVLEQRNTQAARFRKARRTPTPSS